MKKMNDLTLMRGGDMTAPARAVLHALGTAVCAASMVVASAVANDAASDELMRAKVYQGSEAVADFLVSEKLDGVRARWDGTQLTSRNGNRFAAPSWWLADFPQGMVLDGELWSGRGEFERVVSIVSDNVPSDEWMAVRFWIFEMPQAGGTFASRVQKMQAVVAASNSPYLKMVEQISLDDSAALMKKFDAIIASGGEGLMLHKKTALYQSGRSDDLLKLKPYTDAEAKVIGYKDGQGKYEGMVGSLHVETKDGVQFFVGSGLSDAQRKTPPPIGSIITYRHQGFTKNNIPRFPVFLRPRPPLTLDDQ